MSLQGKTAIITGAGRGIGRAIARRLSADGMHVVLAARNATELEETHRLIGRGGGSSLAIRADVSRVEDVERLIERAVQQFQSIDVLVNNAGIAPLATLEAMEPEQFDALIATNIRSVYLCCRAVWMRMKAGGVIVNISSVAATDPFPGFGAYGASKAFVNTFGKALNAEGAARGIRVYNIAPGAVDTQMLRIPFPDFPDDKTLAPNDVAVLVRLLLSPGAEHLAGQTIVIRKE